jgi:hypothetical protein
MTEELDLLGLLIDKIEYEIIQCKDSLKSAKHDIKKLEKSKADLLETGIADYVFDNKISSVIYVKETLEKRLNVLKKIKYRLVVSERMFKSLE